MSARVPFIPQRPASRPTAGANDKKAPSNASNDFSRLSPVNLETAKDHHISGEPPSLAQSLNKPLNLSGLTKKKPSHQANSSRARRPSDENAKSLPPNQQSLRLNSARPTSPFFPNNSGFIPLGSSRLGSGTNAFAFGANDEAPGINLTAEFSLSKAHIVTSATSGGATPQEAGAPMVLGSSSEGNRFPPALHPSLTLGRAPSRSSLAPSLEKIQEAAEEEDATGAYGTWDGGSERERRKYPPPSYRAIPNVAVSAAQQGQHPLRRTNKRIQQAEEDDELEYGNAAKRFKGDGVNGFSGAAYSRGSSLAFDPQDPENDRQLMLPGRQPDLGYTMEEQDPQQERQGAVLRRILGQDLDAFVDARYESYEQTKRKWADCSIEEWKAGADEMTGKFGHMLDFVKAHMTLKLALYTKLHSTVATHRGVLAEREKVLSEARDSLVREGANVVSGKSALLGGSDPAIKQKTGD